MERCEYLIAYKRYGYLLAFNTNRNSLYDKYEDLNVVKLPVTVKFERTICHCVHKVPFV